MRFFAHLFLPILACAACATRPGPAEGGPAIDLALITPDLDREPAQTTPEQKYRAFKWMIVDSTILRIDAGKRGDVATACNAIRNDRNSDTMAYYVSFEALLHRDSTIGKRLHQELGPFSYQAHLNMHQQRLPRKLHDACMARTRDPHAIKGVVLALEGILIQEAPVGR